MAIMPAITKKPVVCRSKTQATATAGRQAGMPATKGKTSTGRLRTVSQKRDVARHARYKNATRTTCASDYVKLTLSWTIGCR